jgi:DNA-binding CsgD family transcriptional regulator
MLQNFSKTSKIKLILKNTIIDKTLTYASETSALTKRERESNLTFLKGKYTEEF